MRFFFYDFREEEGRRRLSPGVEGLKFFFKNFFCPGSRTGAGGAPGDMYIVQLDDDDFEKEASL